jgi:hypothetical protein
VHVGVDASGDDQQAVGAEFALAGHRAPDLGYPAILHPDVGDLLMARGNDGPAADDELKTRDQHWFLARPVRRWRLQDAELVAVGVSQDVPLPPGLPDRFPGQDPGPEAGNPAQLRLKITGAQVKMNPILALLALGDPLQQDLGALAAGREQGLIAAAGHAVAHVSQHAGPESGGALQVRAVDHDGQFTSQVRMWLAAHGLILPRNLGP